MTRRVKFVRTMANVEMFILNIIFLIFVKNSKSAFFDLTDIDDPLALLWHTKGPIDASKFKSCTVNLPDGFTVQGECKHKSHCFLSGGQSYGRGDCGILSTCCIFRKPCYKKTKSKVEYFTSDHNTFNYCQYVIEVSNENICQVRLDFEKFLLSDSQEILKNTQRVCQVDYMSITPDTYNIPVFCGNNDGQHVYVHLNSNNEVKIEIHLANRTGSTNAILSPQWRIKSTQLECPHSHHFFINHKNFDAGNDFPLLAPPGAIQYFTAPSGRIRSFGFDGNQGGYISGLNYAIAFRRIPSNTCIRFVTSFVNLRHGKDETSINYCEDYLFVPELKMDENSFELISKFCSAPKTPTNPQIFYSNPPGPFNVHFVSAPNYTSTTATSIHAFDIQYMLLSSC